MTQIVLRHLPTVAAIERQLEMEARGRLLDDEVEELPHLVDDASRELFGITGNDTLYPALPKAVRTRFDRSQWEARFEILREHAREPNTHWHRFGLDLCCEEGRVLHCIELFGRQLVCAANGLHPQAVLAFADQIAKAA
jgi:hypothetical protein